jgi:acetate kinase
MTGAILTLNAGSSSLKFALFTADADGLTQSADGEIDGIGSAPRFVARVGGRLIRERTWTDGRDLPHEVFFDELFAWTDAHLGERSLIAVGHRIVHGGAEFAAPILVDPEVLAKLDALVPLAPLHQPHNLAAVRAVAAARSELAQVACFDTAFHRGHAPEVDRFGLPRTWEAEGVRRYGFHGLSYEYISGLMAKLDPALAAGRMIVAHLGAGASLCAIAGGRSVDTTMGFTALDGLLMATRCGSLDPGVILYLQEAHGLGAAAVEDLLYRHSGLLGVSEISSDMRELLASGDPRAKDAIDLFVFRVVREIGALAASMGGVDGLVFTAGIGENSPLIRRRVCERLAWLGAQLDDVANQGGGGKISAQGAALSIWAIATDEDLMIARHTRDVALGGGGTAAGRRQ